MIVVRRGCKWWELLGCDCDGEGLGDGVRNDRWVSMWMRSPRLLRKSSGAIRCDAVRCVAMRCDELRCEGNIKSSKLGGKLRVFIFESG